MERGITFEGSLVSHPAGDIILKKKKHCQNYGWCQTKKFMHVEAYFRT